MKKLLFIGHYGMTGGAGISLLRTAGMAAGIGYDVTLCLPKDSPMAQKASSEGFKVVPYSQKPGSIEYYSGGPPLFRRTYFKKALQRRPFAGEIIRIAKDVRPDAVILNSITLSFMIPLLKKQGFRAGLFVRETFPKNGSGYMLRRYRDLLSGASGVYFISDYDKDFFGLTATRTATIRNSVPDEFFEPLSKDQACKNLGIPVTNDFRLLYVGGCDTIKGAEVMANAARSLPSDVELIVCGAPVEATEKLFEGASCKVLHIGFCSDMRSAYGAADALVLPIVKPHQARPLFEAGAARVPVIISDHPEVSEYVKNGANALPAAPGDPEALVSAVKQLIADKPLRDAITAGNYEFATKNHTTKAAEAVIREEFARLTGPSYLFITNIPSPYRVEFLAEVNKAVNVTTVFERRTSLGRNKSWFGRTGLSFPHVFPKGINISDDKALNPSVKRIVSDPRYTRVIMNGYSSPTEMVAIDKLRRIGKPYTMWIDGGMARDHEPKLLASLKKKYLSGADCYLSPAAISDDYLTHYGANAERIVRYPFTSLYASDIFSAPASSEEKKSLRGPFGLPADKRIAVAVGNFIRRKGFLELIEAAASCPDLTVVICGGDPTPEYIDLINTRAIHNVRFIGFLNKDQLRNLYRACDFFVLPTREDIWGLVVNEAMACGLPVITTNRCVAGLAMVESGANGLIIDSGIKGGAEEPGALAANTAAALLTYSKLTDEELYAQGVKACEKAREYTYEKAAEVIVKGSAAQGNR